MGRVFLYEYITCGSILKVSQSIAVEGLGMFKSLLNGFEKSFDVNTFIDPSLPFFLNYLHTPFSYEVFKMNLRFSDYGLLIAPETEFILYDLTKFIEKSGCANLGSSSKAVYDATDKYTTYKKIKDLSPRTHVFNGTTKLNFPLIAKPRDGVSGEGVCLINDAESLLDIPNNYLLQEYVKGVDMSASLLIGDNINLLSVNTQENDNFNYCGAKLPVEGIDTEIIFDCVSRIKGLFGYVGVDFILGDELKIIEINPRPTTPIIALNYASDINISEVIVNNYYSESIPDFTPKKTLLSKVLGTHPNSYISFRGYSILIRDLNEDINL
tara:strand:+ start:606 stop:1580 length:975 start_codon:yes stop_codon:yes gene_type:complete